MISPAVVGNGVLRPLVYGAAHFFISTGKVNPDQNICKRLEISVLTIILTMGPAGVVAQLQRLGRQDHLLGA